MPSHRFDRGRMLKQEDLTEPSQDVHLSRIPGVPNISQSSLTTTRSQAQRTFLPSRNRRGSLVSDNESSFRGRIPTPQNTKIPSKSNGQPLRIPQPSKVGSSLAPSLIPSMGKMPPPAQSQLKPDHAIADRLGKLSSAEGRSRNVLRRKAPSIEQYAERNRAASDTSKFGFFGSNTSLSKMEGESNPLSLEPLSADRPDEGSRSRTQDQVQPLQSTAQQRTRAGEIPRIPKDIPEELTGLANTINTTAFPPPTPNFTSTSSPSTRYSESPGPWSSRTSTPTSMSSYSPGITQLTKIGSRLRQPSPGLSRSPLPGQSTAPVPSTIPTTANKDGPSFYPRTPRKAQTHPPITAGKTDKVERKYGDRGTIPLEPPRRPPPRKSSTKFKSPKTTMSDSKQMPNEDLEIREEKQVIKPDQSKTENSSRLPAPTSTFRPPRPSRAGTSDLELKPSPVIQSNMATLKHSGHKRQASSDSTHDRIHRVHNINSSTESFQSKGSIRVPNRYASPYLTGNQSSKIGTGSKDSLSRANTVLSKDPKQAKEPSASGRTRRFGIFSRKGKSDTDIVGSDSKDKSNRRGPAAGTGHEGYGRYAQRGRRSSINSVNGRARSASATRPSRKGSTASQTESEMDDFLLDRLEPVVISGQGIIGADLSRIQSEQSASGVSATSTATSCPGPQYSKAVGASAESLVSLTSQPAETFDSLLYKIQRNEENQRLANRRSFRRSQLFESQEQTPVPLSIHTDVPKSRPSIDSCNTSQTSFSQSSVSITVNERGHDKKDNKKPERKGKWNFFQRSHQNPRKGSLPEPSPSVEVSVAISKLPSARQVAHYALLENEHLDPESLRDIFQGLEESPATEEEVDETEEVPLGLGLKREHGHSVLLPSPPLLGGYAFEKLPSSPKVFFNKDIFDEKETNGVQPKGDVREERRPNRLASVGRIPLVISSRDTQKNQPIPSFSRPFSRADMPSFLATADSQPVQFYNPGRPPVGSQVEALPSHAFYPECAISDPSVHIIPGNNASYAQKDREFLTFPRKSIASGSSSSEGCKSLTTVTAVAPHPGSKLSEDEIWNEYDDFIDTVLSPKAAPKKRRSNSSQQSFEMATRASRTLQVEISETRNGDRLAPIPSENPSLHRSMSSARSSGSTVRLRRSMILSALHSSMSQSPPMPFNGMYGGNGNTNSAELMNQDGTLSVRRLDSESDIIRESSLPTPKKSEADRRRNTILLDRAERDRNGAVEQINLRSSSLMTSRWLSFGRVLFSPAHNHLKDQDQGRVLVIDGLGNDDWSFYCALTYPTATVYSLGFSGPSTISRNPAAWQPPSNHRTIHHANMENPFPFPRGFFTAAVIRFPAACSESGLRATISECKRVLRPGAYLEMNVMDLDMVNMGTRTRKAVRMLKERIFVADPSISLKPASDNIQRLLGKRGFENLNRCIVGVPVAGTILSSSDTSSSNRSVTSIHPYSPNPTSTTQGGSKPKRPPSDNPSVSLGDLLSDSSPSESNDESIAKMVAKVARWWYTRCYEAAILPDGNPDYSIWADRRVLRECQRRGTGFRLLIAFAQKPSEPRRTASI
ncbi:hypothetical protein RJZ56_001022 [Blastomyces dermatitidis]|uniref:Methyltransferase type 11 domain-containing protein n=1 Tax=Ajellomyces dermatitidis (strain ER-3 / ATCC MYA-2586) TaxID=559297 RepID=A0ABP2ET19_AJEDR|nr:uncharacterized protein BDCG_01646 [Blastomyces dermatitidis ER-3]XP_045279679.1 hypothetical protein, variant [Blastomyces dermatitidis ER-3]EQL37200.1 hypothetical protein BDFG_01466 [Blastomyces dermatitidis ATCC 26199]EEQ86526.1 hypothetical protein BDCG_01646 [Blastomyces dermatitidis ER-3]EQL37201.1 hypothetical protein, variant [Blastomyces dermatitidis ATCC 26199]OAS99951.1 hypothetical protein, variant [Blastomyces dermatitidis ER-3]